MQPRSRNVSDQGRALFANALSLTSSQSKLVSPRSLRRSHPSQNAFQALRESDEEDEEDESEELEIKEEENSHTPGTLRRKLSSPRTTGESPRWQVVTSTRPPKLELEEPVVQPVTIPPAFVLPRGADDDSDMSDLAAMTTDTKGRRETRRSAHGSKANRFKAMKQRMDSIAKRNEQREADKIRRGVYEDHEENDYDDEW